MANINKPFGFRPARPLNGGTERLDRFTIADGYNTSIYYGDYVVMTGTGRDIAKGAGTADVPLGVFYGVEYIPSSLDQKPIFSRYWPASTALKTGTTAYAFILPAYGEEFLVQADGSLAAADVGLNADVALGTGSAVTGNSGSMLTVTGKNTTNTLLLGILGLDDTGTYPTNAWGSYARVKVKFNVNRQLATTGI